MANTGLWFYWITGWNRNKNNEIQQEDNNTGSSVNTVSTCDRRMEEVSDQSEEETEVWLNSQNLGMESRTTKMTSTNLEDEWKKENMFLKEELLSMREKFYIMEQKIKSMDELLLNQNFKLKNIVEKLQVCVEVSTSSVNRYVGPEVVYNKTNSRIEKLENLVDALKTEKHYFVQANRKMAKDIDNIRKRSANKRVFNKFRGQMKKNLVNVKTFINFNESNMSYICIEL
uniref:Uncharacterized protein n=1 Tax=Sipha flava TaxID=143950 RepID=A0A2S2Q6F8_9HEMI